MGLVKVNKIYENNTFLEGGLDGSINCGILTQGAKEAWLVRDNSNLVYEQIVTEDPEDATAIKGVLVSEDGGHAILVDGTLADFLAKCNGCCGEDNVVVPVYAGVYPDLAVLVQVSYSIQREDDGSLQAQSKFGWDYLGYIIDKTLQRSYDEATKISTYTFKSYEKPGVFKEDLLVGDASIATFTSNAPGALVAPDTEYVLKAKLDGVEHEEVKAATLADLAVAANEAIDSGIWSVAAGALVLKSSSVEVGTLVITME